MKRNSIQPRENWQSIVEEQGLTFHTTADGAYWDESTYYSFTAPQIDLIEEATNVLHEACANAGEYILFKEWFNKLAIPENAIELIKKSWERDDFSLFGRFDFIMGEDGFPKLLEYNADTPTSLLEASAIQWFWLEKVFPDKDQFNSIHEKLVGAWGKWRRAKHVTRLHLTAAGTHLEDKQTVMYLQDTAHQAGLETEFLSLEEIGWDHSKEAFLDLKDRTITHLFKLHPWEFVLNDEFGKRVLRDEMNLIEPIWKMLFSNKGMMAILWDLFRNDSSISRFLLPAYFEAHPNLGPDYVKKPLLSREGCNVTIFKNGKEVDFTDGEYGYEGFIYQKFAKGLDFGGFFPIIGSWLVEGVSCGIGIREDIKQITGNTSRFCPHVFE